MQSIVSVNMARLAQVREARVQFQAEQAERAERLRERVALRETQSQRPADPTGQRGSKLDTVA